MSKLGKKEILYYNEKNSDYATVITKSYYTNGVSSSKGDIFIQKYTITGPLGTQSILVPIDFHIDIISPSPDNPNINILTVKPKSDILTKELKSLWGTIRSLFNQIITGVSVGYITTIDLVGIGYRVTHDTEGSALIFNLGFSHPIRKIIPNSISVENIASQSHGATLQIFSSSLIHLNNFAAKIKKLKPSEKSYKGTGVKIVSTLPKNIKE